MSRWSSTRPRAPTRRAGRRPSRVSCSRWMPRARRPSCCAAPRNPGWGISARVLGDEDRYVEIFDLNVGVARVNGSGPVLRDPNLIWPDLRLRIPSDDTTAEPPSPPEPAPEPSPPPPPAQEAPSPPPTPAATQAATPVPTPA